MFTVQAMLGMHAGAHASLRGLLEHCATLEAGALCRDFAGFGYPSVSTQFAHLIGAEAYWVGVLQGRWEVDEDDPVFTETAALEAYRAQMAAATRAYLEGATTEELNTARPMMTWPRTERVLVPARAILRVVTHAYDHKGQIAALCRLLGKPIPAGLDFPLA